MYTIKQMAQHLNLKLTTFRYWLQRNQNDFQERKTCINLENYCSVKFLKNKKFLYFPDIQLFTQNFYEYKQNRLKQINNKKEIKIYWTEASCECWKNKGNCKICYNNWICKKFENPPIKEIVKKLLEQIGEPNRNV